MFELELHNVAQQKTEKSTGFTFLYRFPQDIVPHLGYKTNTKGQQKASTSSGIELRIHTLSTELSIDLMAQNESTFITTFIGDFEFKRFFLPKNERVNIQILHHERMQRIGESNLKNRRFTPYTFRILCEGAATVGYQNIVVNDCTDTLPAIPKLPKICAYGSSITQGVGAMNNMNSYLQTFANYARIDVLNKGMSGSCLCEKAMVDYLATVDCNAYLLELGCNMRGVMDQNVFQERVVYLLDQLAQTNRPIYIIDMLSFFNTHYKDFNVDYKELSIAFSFILEALSKQYAAVQLIKSTDLLEDVTCISYDMLHPSEYGHMIMGRNLAKILSH